jgi:release factor glutamine methyltransferase
VPLGAICGLEPEVARHDPGRALDGGRDGFDAHRELAGGLQRLLRPSGFACIEVGMGQAAEAAQIYAAAGLDEVGRHCDFRGIERCLVLAPRR